MSKNKIATIRKIQGYTQQAIADRVGVTRQQISAIEKGKTLPSVSVAKAIAHILGIKWETFFDSER
ncbi:MAG: helix-turn-helix transcriptional regulator [Eubacterium sp.]|nr:helix-turn-helix transcriptional regulator [Eubacterium sp.]